MKGKSLRVPLATAALFLVGCPAPESLPTASLLFTGGTILTLDPTRPAPQALAVAGGRIVAMGDAAEIEALRGTSTRGIDLAGRTLAPAFIDHHVHLLNLGLSLVWGDQPPPYFLDLSAFGSLPALAEAVESRAGALPPGSWILGKSWSQGAWGDARLPSHEPLSRAAPGHPVFMTRVDGHAGWLNAAALERAAITAQTPDPAGGAILRDASGAPSGVLLERANERLRPWLPEPDDRQVKDAFRRAAEALFAQGVTQVFDAGFLGPPGIVDLTLDLERYLTLLVEADREAPLPLTVKLMIPAPSPLAERLTGAATIDREPTPRIRITHLKLFVDGALGSRGALLSHPYADDPHTRGVERMTRDELARESRRALDAGLDVATHAIGDAAIARALDVYQDLLAERPDLDPARLRVEHFSYATETDLRRAAALGIVVSVNPDFVAPDDSGRAMEDARVGDGRSDRVYAFGDLAQAGARLAFGSDYFSRPLAPLVTFYGAVARKNANGLPAEGWHSQQVLSRVEALRILTTLQAPGGGEPRGGVLELGAPANLVLLSGDPLTVPEEELLGLEVEATWAGGAADQGSGGGPSGM